MGLFDTPLSSFLQGAQVGNASNRARGSSGSSSEPRLLVGQATEFATKAQAMIDGMQGPSDVREVASFLQMGNEAYGDILPPRLNVGNFMASYGPQVAEQAPRRAGPAAAGLAESSVTATATADEEGIVLPRFEEDGLGDVRNIQKRRAPHQAAGYGSRKAYLDAAEDELDHEQRLAVSQIGGEVATASQALTALGDELKMTRTQILQSPEHFSMFALDYKNYLAGVGMQPEQVNLQMEMLYDVRDNLGQGMSETQARDGALAKRELQKLNFANQIAVSIVGGRGSLVDGVFEIDLSGEPHKLKDFNLLASKIPGMVQRGMSEAEIQYQLIHDYGNKLKSVKVTKQESYVDVPGIATAPQWVEAAWPLLPVNHKYQWMDGSDANIPEGLYAKDSSNEKWRRVTQEDVAGFAEAKRKSEITDQALSSGATQAAKIGRIKAVARDEEPLDADPLGVDTGTPSPFGDNEPFVMPSYSDSVFGEGTQNILGAFDETAGVAADMFGGAKRTVGRAATNFFNSVKP